MEQQTFGKQWAVALYQAANARAVMRTFNNSRPVCTRTMKRANRTRLERKVMSYGAGLQRYWAGQRRNNFLG